MVNPTLFNNYNWQTNAPSAGIHFIRIVSANGMYRFSFFPQAVGELNFLDEIAVAQATLEILTEIVAKAV